LDKQHFLVGCDTFSWAEHFLQLYFRVEFYNHLMAADLKTDFGSVEPLEAAERLLSLPLTGAEHSKVLHWIRWDVNAGWMTQML
jgi:hypothetical protein